MARNVNADTVVFVASSWWQHSDPSFYVVSLSLKRTESEIRRHINEEARNARDDGSYRTAAAAKDDLFWSGVFPERLGDYASGRELDEAIDELGRHGVWYPTHREVHMIEAKQSDVVAVERMIDAYELKGVIEILAHATEQKGKLLESAGLTLEASKWRRAARTLDEATGKIARLNIEPE